MKVTLEKALEHVGHVVDIWLPLKIQYDQTPGIVIGIIHKGRLIYKKGFGFANLETQEKMTADTQFRVASISKSITAVAIMQLVERGKLRLDDKVADYIDWFTLKTKVADASQITIRQILSHTSGVFRDGDTPHWTTGEFPHELKKGFTEKALTIENLTGFKYSNYAYSLLGLVIEKASGISYCDFLQHHILGPLQMKNTVPDYHGDLDNLATGYGRIIPGEPREVFSPRATNAYAAATGVVSTIGDLAKFLSALTLDTKEKNPILSRESKKIMMQSHAKNEEDEYGLGIDITRYHNRTLIGHSGGFNGFISEAAYDTENDFGVVVLSNAIGSSAYAIAFGIFGAIYMYLDKASDFTSTYRVPFQKYEGTYRSCWGDSTIIQFGDVLISFSPSNDHPLKEVMVLEPTKTKHEFIIKTPYGTDARDERLIFSDFKNGKAQMAHFGSMPKNRVTAL